jgi:acylphosphatase
MKLKVTITGSKVQDVGYRYFLMTLARRARIRYFDAENIDGSVEALVDGDEGKIAAFKSMVETSMPDRAQVSNIAYESYDGEIWPINEYSQFCTNVQLNKAIPILLTIVEKIDGMNSNLGGKMDQMLDKQDQMLDKQDQALGKMDQMLDKQGQALGKMDQMLEKQDETIDILSDTDEKIDRMLIKQGETTDAVKDLKLDNRQLDRIENDIRDIKTKIGAR